MGAVCRDAAPNQKPKAVLMGGLLHADIGKKEPRMPKLVTTDDLKDTLERFREKGDAWWLKRAEAEEMVSEAIDDNVGPLTVEELEEVLEEMSEE